jgi:DTW domain-containing protein YfiP
VRLDTRVVVIQANREQFKPTNTARLLPRVLEGARIVLWGQPGQEAALPEREEPGWRPFVLFPGDDAVLPDDLPRRDGGRLLAVVLDGTWHQCSRMRRRIPSLAGLPTVRLPPGPPSRWTGRRQHDPRGVSTFEAVTRLLAALHGPAAAVPLQDAFSELAARLARMQGRAGPLPAGAGADG